MKIRILVTVPGRSSSAASGAVIDLPDEEAQVLIDAGRAEALRPTRGGREQAVKPPRGEKR